MKYTVYIDLYISIIIDRLKLYIVTFCSSPSVPASASGRHTCSPSEFLGLDLAGRLVTSVSLPGLHHQQERLQAFKVMPRAAVSSFFFLFFTPKHFIPFVHTSVKFLTRPPLRNYLQSYDKISIFQV